MKDAKRNEFIEKNHLTFLRPYQLEAIKTIQNKIKEGSDRFLFRDGNWYR